MLVTGVDIIELERMHRVVARWGERFLRRVYTEQELAYCRGRIPQLAARFAAKEATMKALGTGRYGVGWRDVEVTRQPPRTGPPRLHLHGRAQERAQRLGLTELSVSLSHSREYAVAFVVGMTEAQR